ncbi:hypothetical protein [Streptomyces pseudovenezuelae]|uniref:Transcriptional regulator with XRE-family HTH domain n=1 Tax=Streptomyces pseudovenezuelae TaxID=67350 RepID=A0ABT6LE60_9ACTN|nr:hypothetical protein [Streptomyces pseudovenezuelae]MDH6214069.1 transcriptional regulator with XRE-family HTH domain [Streptomyces pseudovenezuelae]
MPLGPDTPLSSKLAVLIGRKLRADGKTLSTRDIATCTAEPPGGKPAMTHQVVNDLLNGVKANPTVSQLIGLARALGSPVAYLLPSYNGLTSLSVYEDYPDAREALRLIHDLGDGGAAELLEAARAIRLRHGRSDLTVPEVPEPLLPFPQPPRPGRRRRLSFTEAAERAVSDPEGT